MKFFNNLLREKSTKSNPGLLASAINDHWHPKPRRLMLVLEPRINSADVLGERAYHD